MLNEADYSCLVILLYDLVILILFVLINYVVNKH